MTAYNNNAGLISKVTEEISSETLKIAVVDNPTVVLRPSPEAWRISAFTSYCQKLESLRCIFCR